MYYKNQYFLEKFYHNMEILEYFFHKTMEKHKK